MLLYYPSRRSNNKNSHARVREGDKGRGSGGVGVPAKRKNRERRGSINTLGRVGEREVKQKNEGEGSERGASSGGVAWEGGRA